RGSSLSTTRTELRRRWHVRTVPLSPNEGRLQGLIVAGNAGTLVAEVAALGLAVAFTSPVPVVTVIVLISLPSGRRRALAYVSGWLIAIAAIGAVMVLVLHGQDFGSNRSTPSRAA